MAPIVTLDFTHSTTINGRDETIDIKRIKAPRKIVRKSTLLPAEVECTQELAGEHTAEPIKDIETINRISRYLIEQGRYRDNLLFIMGINFGFRVSDLRMLKPHHIINPDYTFKRTFSFLEKKTKNTRKKKQNRHLGINDAVIEATILFLENTSAMRMDDYFFRSESNRGGNTNTPLSRMSIDRILKGIAKDLDLDIKMSSHSLRKTFGYHQMLMSGNDPRKLVILQKMFGHSSMAQTLDYIGITKEEMEEAYMNLNLGSLKSYPIDSIFNYDTTEDDSDTDMIS